MCNPGRLRVKKVWAQLTNPCDHLSHQIGFLHVGHPVQLHVCHFVPTFFVSHHAGHLVYLHVGNHNVVSTFVRADDDRMEIRKYLQLRDVRG